MAILNLETAIARIATLTEQGYDLRKIRACLVLEDYTNSIIEEAIKSLGLKAATSRKGTYQEVLSFIENGPVSEKELYEFIIAECTPNEARWINDRNKVRVVVNKVYAKAGVIVKEEAASKELKQAAKDYGISKIRPDLDSGSESDSQDSNSADLEKAKEALRKAKTAWAKGTPPKNKNAFHPDKVSYLGDDALTKMYTAFFQDITA